jgi:hypothetical protein
MQKSVGKMKSILTIITLAAFLAIAFFAFFDFGMTMNADGSMGNCPFSPNGSICAMTLQEHMSIWQTMFAATPQKLVTMSLVLFALWMSFVALIFRNLLLEYSKLLFYDYRLYTKQYSYISLIDPIQRAIYRGRITPKIF